MSNAEYKNVPVIPKEQIADYYLMTSRHFFPGKYIITKSINFDETLDISGTMPFKLEGIGGPRVLTPGNEIISFSGVLTLPIFIDGQRGLYDLGTRPWVDGLDFLYLILGQNFADIDNPATKIFGATPYYVNNNYNIYFNDYDASAIEKISLNFSGENPILVTISFVSNKVDVFTFVPYNNILLNPALNNIFTETRTAQKEDCTLGFQNTLNQIQFKIMTEGNMDINFNIEQSFIGGSGVPRPVFIYNNYSYIGNFAIVDNISNFNNISLLQKADLQPYNTLVYEQPEVLDQAFSFNFLDIDPNAQFKFSDGTIYNLIRYNIANGVLMSNVNFLSYGRTIT